MSSNLTNQHSSIKDEIQKLQSFEQNCLQGLANCDQSFQNFAANSSNQMNYQQQFEKTEKNAMITTYTFLYLNNLKEEKMAELGEIEKKMQNEMDSNILKKSSVMSEDGGFQ
uniref:Uncharacterized protein n=1 Tax=Caenorhabditis tropicalis TaxID=1561998 RepID=A0A1I7UC55_9PELO